MLLNVPLMNFEKLTDFHETVNEFLFIKRQLTLELHGLSPRANHIDGATAACRRSDCQLLLIGGAMWSA
jgi:hypothetical protein